MNDLVGRLQRELPDTDKNRYDIAYERGRAQARSSLLVGGLAIGLAAGSAVMFLLDPREGRGRRAELAQRFQALRTDLQRTMQGRGRDLGNRAFGAATELGLPGTPPSNAELRELQAADAARGTELRTAPRSAAAPLATAEPEGTDERATVSAGPAVSER